MKVLYDHQIFWYQRYGGISNYFVNVMDYAYKNKTFDFDFSTLYSNNRYLEDKNFSNAKKFLPKHIFAGKNSLFVLLKKKNERNALKLLKDKSVDLFHPTYFETYYFNQLKKPLVISFFDLTMEKFPQYFNPRVMFDKEKREILKKANQVLVCSKNTKKDLVNFYDYDPKQVSVANLTSSLPNKLDKSKLSMDPSIIPNNYLLFIGGRGLYKNFNFFVQSVVPLLDKDPTLHIVCAGEPLSTSEQAHLTALGVLDRIVCISVKDHDLIYLYQNAKMLVFPSEYEGFGIPIIEAFNNKCPVALSNASCFPEVAGKAAVYFDPKDASSIKNAVEDLLTNKSKVKTLTKKGITQAQEFTTEKISNATKAAYKKALK